jgi:hypothetical protein
VEYSLNFDMMTSSFHSMKSVSVKKRKDEINEQIDE